MNPPRPLLLRFRPAKSFSFLVLLLVLFSVAASAPAPPPAPNAPHGFTRDLGEGLAYYRVTTLPSDLPVTDTARKQPRVLDLRYVPGDITAGAALSGWLKFNAAPRTPVFLLINADTSGALLRHLATRPPAAGVIVIGVASPGLTPDLPLKISADTERLAYDALAAGAPIASLLNDAPEKLRNDEARLAKDHLGQPDPTVYARPVEPLDAEPPDADPLPAATADKPAKPAAPPPLIDSALQRAVQLHRSLKALKRL